MITIALHGQPGDITGQIEIDGETWQIATWRAGGDPGHVIATTTDGQQVTMALGENSTGGITIGRRRWELRDYARDGMTLTARSSLCVTDAEMAAMFPDAGWAA